MSENVITRDRMTDVSVHGPGGTAHPGVNASVDRGLSTYLTFGTKEPGTYAIGVSTRPRMITMKADAFADYLMHEGVNDALAAFKKRRDVSEVRERYSKHVRSIVQVGDQRSDDHRKARRYPVEIILEQNPYDADPGDTIGFQVLRKGVPLAGQMIYASHDDFAVPADDQHARAQSHFTGADGRGEFQVTEAGIWYLTLIHMERLENDRNADYESNWATVTFEVD